MNVRYVSFAFLVAALWGAAPEPSHAEFDGVRAHGDLEELVRIGPRETGSAAATKARQLIAMRMRQNGWVVTSHAAEAVAPEGRRVALENLIATKRGSGPQSIVLLTHYDTPPHVVGANHGGSGVAVLIELARQLATEELQSTIELVFCDGHEPFGGEITLTDGLYGSRALAAQWERKHRMRAIRALLAVDMVGDRELELTPDARRSPALHRRMLRHAQRLGIEIDTKMSYRIDSDHGPFYERGVRDALALVDYRFGAGDPPGSLWDTPKDQLDAVSAESLGKVGELLLRLVLEIDRE